jgi:hypothetical protein
MKHIINKQHFIDDPILRYAIASSTKEPKYLYIQINIITKEVLFDIITKDTHGKESNTMFDTIDAAIVYYNALSLE